MTITFQVADATFHTESEPCVCQHFPEEEECMFCQGSGIYQRQVSDLPDLNMGNRNALDLLALINVGVVDSCGEWSVAELSLVHTRLMELRNTSRGSAFELSSHQEGNFYSGGRDSSYVDHRLGALLAVVVSAKKNNAPVFWC